MTKGSSDIEKAIKNIHDHYEAVTKRDHVMKRYDNMIGFLSERIELMTKELGELKIARQKYIETGEVDENFSWMGYSRENPGWK